MFRCDFDVMESLEEFEDLNTPILSGTEHRAGQGQGPSRNPAASAQRHREIRGEKGRGRGCLCKLRRGLKQKYSQRAKAGRLKNPREINRIERAYVQETTTKRRERGHLDIYMARDVQKKATKSWRRRGFALLLAPGRCNASGSWAERLFVVRT